MGLKRSRPSVQEEMRHEGPDEGANDEDPGKPDGVKVEGHYVQDGFAYMVGVFSWSDGKTGQNVKVWCEKKAGESDDDAAKRTNRFAVLKLRELESAMSKA